MIVLLIVAELSPMPLPAGRSFPPSPHHLRCSSKASADTAIHATISVDMTCELLPLCSALRSGGPLGSALSSSLEDTFSPVFTLEPMTQVSGLISAALVW